MAFNKNQHFIPVRYLKTFSTTGDNKTINLFNLSREKIISGASIKSQCSKGYFYGKDPVKEGKIQMEEGAYGRILPSLLKFGHPVDNSNRASLSRFCFLQSIRTEAVNKQKFEAFNQVDKIIGRTELHFNTDLKEIIISSLEGYLAIPTALDDLRVVLCYNSSSVPFITSDNPVVIINKLFSLNKQEMGRGSGVGAAGIICVLPLSPKVCCIFYDSDIYSVSHHNNWVKIKKDQDVKALNELQYLNCMHNVYFHDLSCENFIHELHDNNKSKLPLIRYESHHFTEVCDGVFKPTRFLNGPSGEIQGREIIHTGKIDLEPPSWPTFLRWRNKGKYYTDESAQGPVRKKWTDVKHLKRYTKY